jgi:hypothetical protein
MNRIFWHGGSSGHPGGQAGDGPSDRSVTAPNRSAMLKSSLKDYLLVLK